MPLGRPFVKRFALCYRTLVCLSVCHILSCLPDCNVGILWPNGRMNQDETWHKVGLGPGHIVLDGDPGPRPPKGHSPQFSAHICCGQIARWIKMLLGRKVCINPSDIVLDGDSAPPSPKRGQSPQFSAHVYGGQTVAWIKMPLGTEVGLDPGNIVLDGDIAPAKKGHNPRLQPRSIVAKRSPISATAEHLFLFGVEMSDLNAVIFTGQPAGLSDRLLVGSAHENLDRFHICHYASPATHFF